MIKEYLFGTQVSSDWKVGSPIRYRGVWQGRTYEDKGVVLGVVPEKVLETSYWSSMSGLPDKPENYKMVMYELTPEQEGTRLTITQDNNATEEERDHSEQIWRVVLGILKGLLEK
ncbi:MAG: SRPBCC domain-containing protein [Methanomicrobiales archaeon]|nr:SRPBCC domain-containing protein [Methanomicrobiales archaeon]